MTDKPKARPGGDQAIEELLAELALTGIDRQRFAAGKYGVAGPWVFALPVKLAGSERNGVAGPWVFDRGLATVKAANDAEDDR